MQRMEPLLSDKSKIVYKAGPLAGVTDAFIGSLPWPKEIPALGLVFDGLGGDEHALIGRNISDKYSVRVVYEADLDSLNLKRAGAGGSGILAEAFPDKASLVRAYVDTQREYFYKPWAARIPMALLENARAFAEKSALPERSLRFMKGGEMVGMAAAVKWQDWFGAPADLLAWVWFSAGLSAGEREEAHARLLSWLRQGGAEKFICSIDSFNVRSQKFFKKIGFSPKCLIVNRAAR